MFFFKDRQLHPIFHFHSYHYQFENPEKLIITYDFEIENLVVFKPALEIHFPKGFQNTISPDYYCHLVFQYGLAEMISYWKVTCSPLIRIHCGILTSEQIIFWQDLFYQGLGEFRYINQITNHKNEFVKLECDEIEPEKYFFFKPYNNSNLEMVPIGGGKDSIVTLEILCKNRRNPLLFFLNPTNSGYKIAAASGVPQSHWVIVKRQIDKNLLKLNDLGYLNGHTPFSALLAFMTILVSVPLGVSKIILSNESSAEEGNVLWNGEIVNHQYSKSFDFEKNMDRYAQQYLTPQTRYFSFLRPLKEIQIAKLFAKFTKYHEYFKSCNVGQKNDIWCCQCSKCLFVWVI